MKTSASTPTTPNPPNQKSEIKNPFHSHPTKPRASEVPELSTNPRVAPLNHQPSTLNHLHPLSAYSGGEGQGEVVLSMPINYQLTNAQRLHAYHLLATNRSYPLSASNGDFRLLGTNERNLLEAKAPCGPSRWAPASHWGRG